MNQPIHHTTLTGSGIIFIITKSENQSNYQATDSTQWNNFLCVCVCVCVHACIPVCVCVCIFQPTSKNISTNSVNLPLEFVAMSATLWNASRKELMATNVVL